MWIAISCCGSENPVPNSKRAGLRGDRPACAYGPGPIGLRGSERALDHICCTPRPCDTSVRLACCSVDYADHRAVESRGFAAEWTKLARDQEEKAKPADSEMPAGESFSER